MPVENFSVHRNSNKRIGICTGKMGYFFYNFIRYKIFLLATYQTVLLHCTIYCRTLVWLGSLPPWTVSRVKDIPLLSPLTSLLEQSARSFVTFPSCAWIRWRLLYSQSSTSARIGLRLFRGVLFRTFPANHFGTPGETKSKFCWLPFHIVQVILLTRTRISVIFNRSFLKQICSKV